MDTAAINAFIQEMPDEVLESISFSAPWQMDPNSDQDYTDADGAPVYKSSSDKEDSSYSRDKLQSECWSKFHESPHLNTSIRGTVGRLTGLGFEVSSDIFEIDEVLEEIELDPRNRLYNYWPKYVGRTFIEGELFLVLTCHKDGFIEVDFLDPSLLKSNGDDQSGIIFHPTKTNMPLFYNIDVKNGISVEFDQIPSVFVARYPDLIKIARSHNDFKINHQKNSKNRMKVFRQFGGFYRFIVSWDRGFVTRRAISYLRTTLQWLNHYENLKKYEIDHKKSSGAYLWVFKITEARSFKMWLQMSDEEKRKTGIMAKKTPGSSLILPPGMDVDVVNPNLSQITEQDEDIKEMIASGLNEPSDVMTGTTKGSTFSSITASRGPMSDRTSDEIAYFERFLRHDFWSSIFFLKSKISNFKEQFEVDEAYDFDKSQKPLFRKRKRRPEQLIHFSWPVSETVNYESRARAFLGVKHGPIAETLGIPNAVIARKMGFGSYRKLRLQHATEKERLPELVYNIDAESMQETLEGDQNKKKTPEKNANTKSA